MKLKNMNKKWMKRATLVVMLGGLIYGGYSYTNQDQDTTASASASTIQEYTLTKSQITETLSTSGTVQADSIEQLLGDVTSEVISDQLEEGMVILVDSSVDISTTQRQGGMMIPGMGGPPEGGGQGQRNKKAGN